MQSVFFLAQGQPASPGGQMFPIFFFILLFAGMWFLVIAPQKKRQKQQEAMIKALVTGDRIVTVGGIYGEITNVKEDRLVVKIADNVKIELSRQSVGSKVDPSS